MGVGKNKTNSMSNMPCTFDFCHLYKQSTLSEMHIIIMSLHTHIFELAILFVSLSLADSLFCVCASFANLLHLSSTF